MLSYNCALKFFGGQLKEIQNPIKNPRKGFCGVPPIFLGGVSSSMQLQTPNFLGFFPATPSRYFWYPFMILTWVLMFILGFVSSFEFLFFFFFFLFVLGLDSCLGFLVGSVWVEIRFWGLMGFWFDWSGTVSGLVFFQLLCFMMLGADCFSLKLYFFFYWFIVVSEILCPCEMSQSLIYVGDWSYAEVMAVRIFGCPVFGWGDVGNLKVTIFPGLCHFVIWLVNEVLVMSELHYPLSAMELQLA